MGVGVFFKNQYDPLVETEILIAVFGVVMVAGAALLFFRRTKALPRPIADRSIAEIKKTKSLDPAHAILESHKIFVWTLAQLIPSGKRRGINAAGVVQKFAPRFPNTPHVWKSHRLRNRIAHEPNVRVSKTHADLARKDFIRAIESITR